MGDVVTAHSYLNASYRIVLCQDFRPSHDVSKTRRHSVDHALDGRKRMVNTGFDPNPSRLGENMHAVRFFSVSVRSFHAITY